MTLENALNKLLGILLGISMLAACSRTITANSYDQTCTADQDCVVIGEGDACSGCRCPNAAINRKDEAKFNGDYRTKRVILEIYDAMAEAQVRLASGERRMASGGSGHSPLATPDSPVPGGYQTLLNPPPADPRCCHPPREQRPSPAAPVVRE